LDTRRIIAWALIAILFVGFVAAAWLIATSRQRQRRRENRDFDRASARAAGEEGE
jgi:hypothetical protein